MMFEPNYRHILDVANNKKPVRLPLYEHIISPIIMEKVLNIRFADLESGSRADQMEFFRNYCQFFKTMTYDTVSYEVCLTEILPGHGAMMGGIAGPIQSRRDFQQYPWDKLPQIFWEKAAARFDCLVENLPDGMKIVGGAGNGVFEISEDLVGLEYLAYMQADDPELFDQIYKKIGDLMLVVWDEMIRRYSEHIVLCRFGDDLGHKTGTLTSPSNIRKYILPQYKRVIDRIKQSKLFLWHSCGCIFDIMEEIIDLGISAKHSNEDGIAPFEKWIQKFGDRIGLFGGIDVGLLCQATSETITEKVFQSGIYFRKIAKGYAIGSGNSIPEYIPVENYLAMIEGAQKIRDSEDGYHAKPLIY